MNKTEFLDQLRQSLNGKVDAELVGENIRYYAEYIESQLSQGMTEQEIMSRLGSPRLIARTIMDANLQGDGYQTQGAYQQSRQGGSYQGAYQQSRQGDDYQRDTAYKEPEDAQRFAWQDRWQEPFGNMTRSSAGDFFQSGDQSGKLNWLFKFFRLPRWLRYVVGIGVFFLVLAVLLLILEFLAPIIIMGAVAIFLVKLFRDWLN